MGATRAAFLAAVEADRAAAVAAPENTCVSKGVAKWLGQIGVRVPNFSDGSGSSLTNVSDFHAMAARGLGGFELINPADAIPGDILIWPEDDHISVYVDNRPGGYRSVGAGGPTGVVAYQPRGGRTGNPASYFIAAVRPPFEPEPLPPAPAPTGETTGLTPEGWLQKGSYGPKVRRMKERLVRDYYYAAGLEVDDEFGDFCDWVVREFQRRAGLKADGKPGPVMFERLGLTW